MSSSNKKEKENKLKKGGQRVKKFINRGQASPGGSSSSPGGADGIAWRGADGSVRTDRSSRTVVTKANSKGKAKPTSKEESSRANRLLIMRKLGLFPADKDPFSKQDMEFMELGDLWSKFLKTLGNEMSITTSGLMKSIVAVFNPMYSHWSEEFELDGIFRSEVVRKSFYIPIIDQHAANCIISIYQTFIIGVVDAIRDGNTCHNLKGLEIITFVNLLTRVDENRAVLRSSAILNQIISLIKMVLVKIREPFATNTKSLEQTCDVESIYIQVLLANCYQIVMNYISFQWCWREDLSEVCSASKESVMEDTKAELLKQGLLKIIKGYLDHLTTVAAKSQLAGSQDDFMWLLVNCVGALLRKFNPAKEQLVHTGIIEVLLGCIGWPVHIVEDGSDDVTAATNPKLREEFKRQLLCLEALYKGVQGNSTNARRISSLGGWEKIMDMILWVTEVFSINPLITRAKLLAGSGRPKATVSRWNSGSKRATGARGENPAIDASPSPSEGFMQFDENRMVGRMAAPEPNLPTRTRELDTLFKLLFNICMGTAAADPATLSKEQQSSQGTDLSKINRVVVNIIIDLFNVDIRQSPHNVRVRTKLKTEYCELQIVVLQFIVRMVEKSPVSAILCRRYRLWDALFSDSFFYCGLDEGISASEAMQEKDSLRGGIFSSLRAFTMEALEFLAVVDEHDNIDEIHKVLELLDTYHNEPALVLQVSRSLISILQHNLIQTQKSLARLNALPIIGVIIEEQQQETASYLTSTEDEEHLHLKETFFRARYSVLALLTHMLARNDEMIYNTINDSRIVNVVFSLLFEPEMRRYAMAQTVQLMAVKIDAKHSADNSELLKLYDQYFKLFRRAQAGSLPTSFKLLLQLLEGVRTVIDRNPRTQRLFKDVGAFLNITTVLNAEENPERMGVVCLAVLRTIASLMKGNQKNRDHMRTNIGYDTLKRLILRALHVEHEALLAAVEGGKPSSEPGLLGTQLVPLLFDMLVDGNFDLISHYTIANPDIVLLMFGIILELPRVAAQDMLKTFTQIVEKCPLNQNLCCAQNLIHHLLGMISELKKDMGMMCGIISLIEVLGTHSITVKELKRLFLLLKSEEGDFRHVAQTILMKALQFMALSRSLAPASFFDLDGRTGALVLPPLEKFPSNHGYTFSVWFRVESFSDPTDKPHYQSRLVSFLDESGMGIELYFTPSRSSHLDKSYHLTHTVCSTSGKTASATFTQFFFKENRWYLMALTHSNHRKFRIGDSESKLFINGELKQKLSLKYPQLPPVLSRSMFGNNIEVRSPVRKILRRNPFFGQLGPVMVFDDQLNASQVQFVFNLFAENAANDSGTSCFGELESKIILYFNSTARVAKFYLDLSPEKNREKRLDAKQVGNIFPCVKRDVKDIIHCLGGIKVLLPLFAQLDQPLAPNNPGEEIDYTTDTQYILQALALLGDMLGKSETNEREMERCQGFPIIGFLLEKAVPEHFTSETLVTLDDFLNKVSYEPLLDDMWKNIICNWHIWIYANPNVQWELAEMVTNAVKARKPYMMRTHTAQDLLDVLYFFYWYQPKGIKLRAQDPVYHPVTKKLVGQRPSHSELAVIRKSLFNAVYALVMETTSEADASAVLGAVIEAADDQQALELLEFSLRLMNSNAKFREHVQNLDGMQVFIMMLRNDQESIRIISVRAMALLSQSLRPRDRLNVFMSVAKLLDEYPLTKPLYNSLFDILIGVPFNPSLEKGGRSHFTIDENVKISCPCVIHVILSLVLKADLWLHQSVLQDLYLLLSNSAENRELVCTLPGWQTLLFQVLVNTQLPKGTLLSRMPTSSATTSPVEGITGDAAADALAAAESLSEEATAAAAAAAEKLADSKVVHEITYNIIKTLLLHSFSSEKLGNRVVQHTLSLMTYFDCMGGLDRIDVMRTLLMKLLGSMQSAARTQITVASSSKRKDSVAVAMSSPAKEVDLRNPAVLANVLHFVTTLEDFLYYTPSTTELHLLQKGRSRPTQGSAADAEKGSQRLFDMTGTVTALTMHFDGTQWVDLELARRFLDTLDLLHLLDNTYAAQIDQIVKEAGKNVILRSGGVHRIALRVATTVIREGDIRACVETVPRIRAILSKDLKSSKVEVSRSVQFVFSSLLLTLQSSLNSRAGGGTSSAAGSAKSKAIVPLMKDLLRACLSILPQGSDDQQLHYFCESGTIREFTESFNTPRWTQILSWAEQLSATVNNEVCSCIPVIDKARAKLNQATLQMIARDEKQAAANEGKAMAGFQQVHGKFLQPEIERKRKVALQADVKRIAVQRQWRRILRSLTNERAPWGESSSEEAIHWKLDKTETFARMRIKLKRNYDFDPHTGAAREHSQASEVDQSDAGKSEEENQLKLFSGMKLAAVGEKEEDLSELKLNDEDVAAILADESEEKKEVSTAGQKEEKLVTSVYCELVTPMKLTVGRCDLTTTHIYFFEERAAPGEDSSAPSPSETDLLKEVKIPLDQLREVHLRRYLLRRSAIEVFLIDRSNFFLNFKRRERNKVYKEIISLSPPNLSYFETGSPEQILRKSDLTRKWQLRKISNFDYLIELNKIAGRTYNDLTQYPVFPWILADYESETIDLKDPSIYRDLSKPVGALNPTRLEMFIARYESFVDPDIPSFHYGSHYSSSGIVLFYLIRTEPFTTHFLQLQGGKFDHADRMFCSIPKCWNNCLNSSADVKELIPEFFYFPDMLVNSNGFNLGSLQDGSSLNDVVLPKWAKTPEDFVRINRAALESDYVSSKLHLWIDLIFGFKQRGRDAVEAANVFYYLTYEGAVDIDAIEDEDKRKATVAQIDNFGQTPAQLLRKSHPQRSPLQDSHQDLCVRIGVGKLTPKLFSLTINNNTDPLVFVCMPNHHFRPVAGTDPSNDDKLITVTETRLAACHKFTTTSPSPAQPFTFEADTLATTRKRVGVPFAADLAITSSCFACSSDGKMILSCGHWDCSIKCSWLDNSRPPQSLREHKDLVTCLALGADGRTFVTGSKDTTILVWEILYIKGSPSRVAEKPKHILYGHNDDVTCVAVDIGLDVCVSGSNDGTCIIHNLRQGDYVRSLYHPKDLPITLVAISTLGHVVFYSQADRLLYLYNINGQFFKSIDVHERLQTIFISPSAEYLITGSCEGVITIRQVHDYPETHVLKVIQKIPTKSRVCSITMSPDETYLLAGLEDGRLLSLSVQEKVRQPAPRQPAGP